MNDRNVALAVLAESDTADWKRITARVADYTMGLNNKAFKNWEFAT